MKPYYYVLKANGGISGRHESVYDAQKKSLRLSAQYPGAAFEILMCVGITQTVKPSTFWMDGVIHN